MDIKEQIYTRFENLKSICQFIWEPNDVERIERAFHYARDIIGDNKFKHGEIIQSDNNKISLEITNINDSRCPSDVVCIWEGEARITLEFKNSTISVFELSTNGPLIDTVDNYIFKLIEVNPYPVSTEVLELKDYRIKMDVEKL